MRVGIGRVDLGCLTQQVEALNDLLLALRRHAVLDYQPRRVRAGLGVAGFQFENSGVRLQRRGVVDAERLARFDQADGDLVDCVAACEALARQALTGRLGDEDAEAHRHGEVARTSTERFADRTAFARGTPRALLDLAEHRRGTGQ